MNLNQLVFANPNFTGIPTAPTRREYKYYTKFATTTYVKNKLDELIDGAPDALNTLNELASYR